MGKTYSRAKFLELTLERRLRVILDLISKIEVSWHNKEEKASLLSLFKSYFSWSEFYNCENLFLQKLSHLEYNIDESMSLRMLLDIAVPMERFLNLSVKDEHIFQVRVGDDLETERITYPLYYVLDHLRSAFNVGSIFRTAECLGVKHIYLVGYTPSPEDAGVLKTAMGTASQVSWSSHAHIGEVVEELRKKGARVVALETADQAEKLGEFQAPESLALVVGNERFGLSEDLLQLMDHCLEIPMKGIKNSLNVANSLSIATFEVTRQWNQ